ncbi:MAG: threonylcarbamoyl-AMP synthase [Pseudomonadales bacterium]|nr:threonylcarbamoyl-AMP synthase [Pseudomonadales bacterium]
MFFQIHELNPQDRLVQQVVDGLLQGQTVVYPTDSGYALGCALGNKSALDTIRSIRRLDQKHNFTLMCRDLSEISHYARVENNEYRLIKSLTPGPYTFILPATREVPKRLMHPKKKTIGIRVPDNRIAMAMLSAMGEPLMSVSLIMPGDDMVMTDPYDIRDTLSNQVDMIIDGGYCGYEPTTVLDLSSDHAELVRQGSGSVAFLESE